MFWIFRGECEGEPELLVSSGWFRLVSDQPLVTVAKAVTKVQGEGASKMGGLNKN